jgi:hypothetical protein
MSLAQHRRISSRIWRRFGSGIALVTLLLAAGCVEENARDPRPTPRAEGLSPHVVSLGNLRAGPRPSTFETQLAIALFGVEPEPPLSLIKPMHPVASSNDLCVCDGALQAVLRWSEGHGSWVSPPLQEAPRNPIALAVSPNGDLLVGNDSGVVLRYSPDGSVLRRYVAPRASPMRAGGIAWVRDAVWVTNVAQHSIEVFDATSGAHRRTIGGRGSGPGEFGFPLGLASGPSGDVYVVDMLNARVQVLDERGQWLRDVGGPGSGSGRFGRPRAIAVGPDGTVFVVDATSQRVHAFDDRGRPLLSFGDGQDGEEALVLPAGIAVWSGPIRAARDVPADFALAYFVLVAEQLARPGLRVYAWSGMKATPAQAMRVDSRSTTTPNNPHWRADRCTVCHGGASAATIEPMELASVDHLCLSCHDGKKATREAHPIGRVAFTQQTQAPPGWPLVEDRIGCLTCHDIRRHCDVNAVRPGDNPAVVRGFDAGNPLASCLQCHTSREWRVNPHRTQSPQAGSPASRCGFCHVSTPRRAVEDVWEFDPQLLAEPSNVCLSCHGMHADPAPSGHLGAPVPASIRNVMLDSQQRYAAARGIPAPATGQPALLPLAEGRVACSTCHNPHDTQGDLAALLPRPFGVLRSTSPVDAGKGLRVPHMELCLHCHEK